MVGRRETPVKTLNVLVAPGALSDGALVELDEVERHHLKVRRADADAEVLVFDGAGRMSRGTIHNRETIAIGVVQAMPRPAKLVLAVGAGDRERFLSVAERCTELGVTHLVPVDTERSQTVDSRFRDSALDKARRRAREACKQSENPWATEVEASCTIEQLPSRYAGIEWLLASAGGGSCPPLAANAPIGWLVGPEGGLTEAEFVTVFATLRPTSVALGPAILRFDTAAVAAAAISQDRRASDKD